MLKKSIAFIREEINRRSIKISYRIILGFVSVVCLGMLLMGGFSWIYLQNLHAMIKQDSMQYLTEISRQVNVNVRNMTTANFNAMGMMETAIRSYPEVETEKAAIALLNYEKQRWDFAQIGMIDRNGFILDESGVWSDMGINADDLASVLGTNSQIISNLPITNSNDIFFVYPTSDLIVNGREIKALISAYEPKKMNEVLHLRAFQGEGYAHIINKNGSVIVRSNHPLAEKDSVNMIRVLDEVELDKGVDKEKIKRDLNEGKSGFFGYTMKDVHKYMSYLPMEGTQWYLLSVVPSSVVDLRSESFVEMTVMVCIFITLFFGLILILFWFGQLHCRKRLEDMVFIDPVTQGNTQKWFELEAKKILSEYPKGYVIVYANIDKFKLMNDREGRIGGDRFLKLVYTLLESMLEPNEILCRLSADHFAGLLRCSDEKALKVRMEQGFEDIRKFSIRAFGKDSINMSFGAYFPEDTTLDLMAMLDRANIARVSAENDTTHSLRYGVYDDVMRKQMLRETELEEWMYLALEQEEFVVLLQPKVDIQKGKVAGAEALVRWKSKRGGFIFPNDFIPLFEKNGFIVQLDFYVFQHVCAVLRSWIDKGKTVLPISVNLSRVNLRIPDFFRVYEEVIYKEEIPPNLIEFEFTETAAYEDNAAFNDIIDRIHSVGCTCSMDDFGSSYSSLNMLKDVDVDVLKLDQAFFRDSRCKGRRNLDIVESVVGLAKKIRVRTVAEGVEQWEQVEFLKQIQCDLVQGYVFAKPMSISAFEEFAAHSFTDEIKNR